MARGSVSGAPGSAWGQHSIGQSATTGVDGANCPPRCLSTDENRKMASTPEQLLCTPAFVFPTAFPGFDPRSHLANFHPNSGANSGAVQAPPPPPPLQHPDDVKAKGNGNRALKNQINDFGGRHLLSHAVPTPVAFPGIDASKLPPPSATGVILDNKVEDHQNQHLPKDKLWPCPSCKVPFKAASELQTHLSAHTKGERTVPCDLCGKLFASAERVRIHVRAAHGEKSCSCDICGSGFSYRCKLLDHMRTHTGDKPFHCDVCGKSFSQKNHLTRHNMIHTGERPYPCDFCGRGFYRKDKLNRHRRIHTVSPSTPRHGRGLALSQSSSPSPSSSSLTSNNIAVAAAVAAATGNPQGTTGNPNQAPTSSTNNPSPNPSPNSLSPFRASVYKTEWPGAPSGVH